MPTKNNSKVLSNSKKLQQRLILPWLNELKRILAIVLKSDQVIQLTTLGELKFLCSTRTEFYRTLNYGGEILSLASFLFLLRKDDIVWDIGASVGLFTMHAAQRVNRVIAYEPDPETAARLDENIKLNGLRNKVDVRQLALGDEERREELHTDGLCGFAPALGNLERHSASISVEMKTIDCLVRKGTQHPSVLKIDIEGAELLALRGARSLLHSEKRPRIIFIEIHPVFLPRYGGSSEEVVRLIRDSGYSILSTENRAEQQHLIASTI